MSIGHNSFQVIGQIQTKTGIKTRTMQVHTKETYQDVWARAPNILVNPKAEDTEFLLSFTVQPAGMTTAIASDVNELIVPQEDKPHVRVPARIDSTPYSRYTQAMVNAATNTLARVHGGYSGLSDPTVGPRQVSGVANVTIKVPEGVVEVNVDTPATYQLSAGNSEEEICFS